MSEALCTAQSKDIDPETHDRLIRLLFTEQRRVHRAAPPGALPLFGTLAVRLFVADTA